ncbi:hypothetical protein KMZ93_04250 [Bradyrhizobium sediminis]|uniref:Uncharacterized protein n=1 Tax=Bradyrhizobium sediminis TaxID=2840469 RepID=A0A975RXF0_9BRAD|nr:hypothetical protein [Bradyrhizobium sediminis]QWG24147.1 hypothetical protein KMZ93_04250 [Bradyrhizobium sediminis]
MPGYLTALGISTESHCFIGDQRATSITSGTLAVLDPRVTMGTGWIGNSTSIGGSYLLQTPSGVGYFDFVPGYSFTSCRIWYARSTGLSTAIGVYIDDVLNTTINSSVAPAAFSYIDISIPGGALKVSFKNNAVSGNSDVVGVECFRAGQTVILSQVGYCGAKGNSLTAATNPWFSLPAQPLLGAHLTTLGLMVNDVNSGTDVVTWKSQISSIIAAGIATSDFVLLVDGVCQGANWTNGLYDSYITAVHELAAANVGVIVVDMRDALGQTNAAAVGSGYMDSLTTNHPNATGHDVISQLLANKIKLAA